MNPDCLDEIYPPAEDTFLLLEAALEEARPEDRAIEIGCGRSLISQQLLNRVRSLVATDINPFAVQMAAECGLEAVRADLFRGIKGRFDLVLFNPPYLPTPEEERAEGWINYALDGGPGGSETIYRFLEDLKDHLHPKGRALLLISSLNNLEEVRRMACDRGLSAQIISSKRYFFEQLMVLKLVVAHE
jgi:release factor glutamine methyltransferase